MEEELKCPKCSSSQTRYRVKTKDRICYLCGHTFKNKEDKE
jgi:ribosomal protein L37AE/L43A